MREWLVTQESEVSSAALIQYFQGTIYEATLSTEQAEIMQWGETFDADAEFSGILGKLRDESRKKKLHELTVKMAGTDIKVLSEQDRELYLQLLQRG